MAMAEISRCRMGLMSCVMRLTCVSIAKTTLEWPVPTFGPTSVNKLGKVGTVVPRCAVGAWLWYLA